MKNDATLFKEHTSYKLEYKWGEHLILLLPQTPYNPSSVQAPNPVNMDDYSHWLLNLSQFEKAKNSLKEADWIVPALQSTSKFLLTL